MDRINVLIHMLDALKITKKDYVVTFARNGSFVLMRVKILHRNVVS